MPDRSVYDARRIVFEARALITDVCELADKGLAEAMRPDSSTVQSLSQPEIRDLTRLVADSLGPYDGQIYDVFDKFLERLAASADITELQTICQQLCTLNRPAQEEAERAEALVDEAMTREAWQRVIELTTRALLKAEKAGRRQSVPILNIQRGLSFLQTTAGDRAENIEQACPAFGEAAERSVDRKLKATAIMQLGVAVTYRLHGDYSAHQEEGILLIRAGLELLRQEPSLTNADHNLLAMMSTNLAVALCQSVSDDRRERLVEGCTLCEEALVWRTHDRNLADWAYSVVNLALCCCELTRLSTTSLEEKRCLRERINALCALIYTREGELRAIGAIAILACSHHIQWTTALSFIPVVENPSSANPDQTERFQLLTDALPSLERAAELAKEDSRRPEFYTHVAQDLTSTLFELSRQQDAVKIAHDCFNIMTAYGSLSTRVDFGGLFGSYYFEQEDWVHSAQFYRDSITAANLRFHGRASFQAQQKDIEDTTTLYRWAAMSFARAGGLEEAALCLENGRSRELRLRSQLETIEEQQLASLPDDLRSAYIQAAQEMARPATISPTLEPVPAASSTSKLYQALSNIREYSPEFREFGTGVRSQDIHSGASPEWPLIYVDPTPAGTLLLKSDGRNLACRYVPSLTSTELSLAFLADTESFLYALLRLRNDDSDLTKFQAALDSILKYLGESLGPAIRDLAFDTSSDQTLTGIIPTGLTILPCGPIGIAPLHAISWDEDGKTCRLTDFLKIRYAPSASLMANAIRKGSAFDSDLGKNRVLVGLANAEHSSPSRALPEAEWELKQIAGLFTKPDTVRCRLRSEATSAFLVEHASEATHLHLGCHAGAAIFAEREEGNSLVIGLADGPMDARTIPARMTLKSRVTVLAGCETAVRELQRADETICIGAIMLVAGSVCTIGSLWSINSFATSLLILRMYDEMITNGMSPPEALWSAQQWLRNLSGDGDEDFFSRHTGRIKSTFLKMHRGKERPYSHPMYWASFIALGA